MIGIAPDEPAAERQAANVFSAAVRLRDTWKIYLGEATRTPVPAVDPSLEALRRKVSKALAPPELVGLPGVTLSGSDMALPLARLALAIGAFLSLPHAGTLCVCEADPCGGVFLDTSRSQKWRWCAMESCGNRVKAQRHQRRMKAEAVEPPKGK
jgi:predicted RNA-binding Zn ribbon-like protein